MIDIYDLNLLTETTMPPIIRCSQGDSGIRQIQFNLYYGSMVYTPENLSATVYGLRPDGASWGPDYCTLNGSTATFTLTEKMTMIGGRSTGELALMDKNGNKIASTNFTLMVETMPLPGTYAESKCDFSGVVSQKLTEAMEKLEQEIEARKASDAELRQKLIEGGFYTDEDMQNKYDEGVAYADGRVNTESTSYQIGYAAGQGSNQMARKVLKSGVNGGGTINIKNIIPNYKSLTNDNFVATFGSASCRVMGYSSHNNLQAGGGVSISYNSETGILSYSGPSNAYVVSGADGSTDWFSISFNIVCYYMLIDTTAYDEGYSAGKSVGYNEGRAAGTTRRVNIGVTAWSDAEWKSHSTSAANGQEVDWGWGRATVTW